MAKVRGFLQGAKGKVGDFVLQKGEKATVLRANNGTANPQSAAQMAQRVSFGTVTNAAKKMLSVIGLSFYGVTNGKLSRRRFVELNLPVLKASADAQLSGEETTNPRCFFKAKDANQLVPNPYIVSDGSLVLPEQLNVITDGDGGDFSLFARGSVNWSVAKQAQTILGSDLLMAMFGCGAGEQITLVSILGKAGENVAYNYENGENVTVNGAFIPNYDWMRFTRLFAPRIVFKRSDLGDLEIVADDTPETLLTKLQTAILKSIDVEKSSEWLYEMFIAAFDVVISDNTFILSLRETAFPPINQDNSWKMHAAGIIRSANIDGNWDFSRCQLKTSMDVDTAGGPGENNTYSGLMLGTAIYSYVGVADANNRDFMTTGTPYDEMPQQA